MTTKTGQLETKEILKQKIKEASEDVALDKLCLSPQSGFASTEDRNLMTEKDQ